MTPFNCHHKIKVSSKVYKSCLDLASHCMQSRIGGEFERDEEENKLYSPIVGS